MNTNIITYIENRGFKVRGKRIYKQNGNPIGQINENNFFIFAQNDIYPFQQGVNYVENTTLTDGRRIKIDNPVSKPANKVKVAPTKENPQIHKEFPVYNRDYIEATSDDSVFNTYLNDLTNKYLGRDAENYYNLRGIKEGYLKGSVVFPILKPDGEFHTGQIIKYRSTGKRVKKGASMNWFHAYKDVVKYLFNCHTDLEKNKYSLSINHFFGGDTITLSKNPVAIVEAPKTASIMKEFYPNIDWIATMGLGGLRNKNLELLRGKDVIIFPDAFSDDWDAIAKVYRWSKFSVLEDYNAKEGSDVVDYFFDVDFKGYNAIRNVLDEVSEGRYDYEAEYKDSLCFDIVEDKLRKDDYFTILNGDKGLIFSRDNSSHHEIAFNGRDFNLFTDKYKVYNAQIDWHNKTINDEEYPTYFNEAEFLYNLKKCYVLLKQFNPEKDYKQIYKKGLIRLNNYSNFRFSVSYVMDTMVAVWDDEDIDVKDYVKLRDWKYKGGEQITKNEFVSKLNDDRFRMKLQVRLLSFQDAMEENRFIDYETDLGLSGWDNGRGYKNVFEMVKQWNEEVIGTKTYKTWLAKNEFEVRLIKHYIENHLGGTKSLQLHIEDIYIGARKVYQEFTYKKISEITSITNKATIKKFKSFKANADTKTLIKKSIEDTLLNIKQVTLSRNVNESNGKVSINGFKSVEPVSKDMTRYNTSPVDAFALPVDEEGNVAKLNASDLMEYSINQHQLENDIYRAEYVSKKLDDYKTELKAEDVKKEEVSELIEKYKRTIDVPKYLDYVIERLHRIKEDNKLFMVTPVVYKQMSILESDSKYVYQEAS